MPTDARPVLIRRSAQFGRARRRRPYVVRDFSHMPLRGSVISMSVHLVSRHAQIYTVTSDPTVLTQNRPSDVPRSVRRLNTDDRKFVVHAQRNCR